MNVSKTWKIMLWYSLFFVVLSVVIFLPFYEEGRSLLWDPDAVVYHIPMAEVFAETVKKLFTEGAFVNYDFSIGMGTDTLLYISQWYMEPLNLLYACFGAGAAENIYEILIIARLYLAGVGFLIFSGVTEQEGVMARVLGALVYVFSGYTLFTGTKAAPFLGAMILLPLIFYAQERIRSGKSAFLFILLIAYSACFSYYFLFMNSVLLAIYVLIELFAWRVKAAQAFRYVITLIGYYLTGLAIAGVVFLPSVMGFLGSSRSGGARNVDSFFYYAPEYYRWLAEGIFWPRSQHTYWLVIGFSPLVAVALIVLFRQKDKVATCLKAAWIIFLAGVSVPIFGCLMNGGKVANNRWLYALIFVGALTVCKTYPVIVGAAERFAGKKIQRCVAALWCGLLILTIGIGGYSLFAEGTGSFVTEFHKAGKAEKIMSNNTNFKATKLADDTLYRVDSAKTPKTASSAWVIKDYRGLVTNVSGYSKEMADFYRFFENTGVMTSFRLNGMDNSTILTTLAGVKYYTTKEGQEKRLPYGYSPIKKGVYENDFAVPFSYGYDAFVLREDTEGLSPVQKQEVLLQAAVVDRETAAALVDSGIEQKEKGELALSSYELPFEIKNEDRLSVSEDGTYIKTETEGAGFDMVIRDIPESGEVYVELKGLSILSEDVTAATIGLREDGADVSSISFQHKEATYSSGNDTYAANIGYSDAKEREIHVSFTQKAEYHIDEICVYYLPFDRYEESMADLTEETFAITEWSDTEIIGKVDVDEKKLLCIPIIYSKGWRVFADGKEQKLHKLNLMYCGLVLNSEMDEIRFEYETPYMKLGMLFTVLGILTFGGIIIWERKKRNSRN